MTGKEFASRIDIAPSFNFELQPYSPSLPFQKVSESFARVGNIMYQIIGKECSRHETTLSKTEIVQA